MTLHQTLQQMDARTVITRLVTAFVMVFLLCVPTLAEAAANRVALVIGMGKYENITPLKNTDDDATALAETLKQLNFSVDIAIDQPLADLVDTINKFAFKAETADVALIYYAGHGVEVDGQNYMIPVDIQLSAPDEIKTKALSLQKLLGAVDSARKLRIVILDSCRNNPFEGWKGATNASADASASPVDNIRPAGLGVPSAEKGMLVVYAAKEGAVALDGNGKHSPFATALMETLGQPDLEIGLMFRKVRDRVMEETGNRQQPHFYGSLSGIPYFLAGDSQNIASLDDKSKAWQSLAANQEFEMASLAQEGNTRAMIGLGYMALNADKSRNSPQKAFDMFSKAADAKDPEAMYELGKLYEKGIGAPQDFAKALSLYQQSADLGFADAINDLGFLYYQGATGLPRDPGKAIALFEKAADLRHPQAMFNVAALIDDGTIKGKTTDDAAHYLYLALRSGVEDVLTQLTTNPDQFKLATRKSLQKILADNQFYNGTIDGNFGKGTQRSMNIAFGRED